MERFIVKTIGPCKHDLEVALAWLIGTTQSTSARLGIIVVRVKKEIRSKLMTDTVSKCVSEILYGGGVWQVRNCKIGMISPRDSKYGDDLALPTLLLFPDKKLLDHFDSSKSCPSLCVLPRSMDEVDYWSKTWNPSEVTAKGIDKRTPKQTTINPVVEVAMEHLSDALGLSKRLDHDLDRSKAIDTIKTLVKGNELFDPAKVRAHLVKKGWSPESANKIEQMMYDLANHKGLHGGGLSGMGGAKALKQWREEAKNIGK